MTTRDLYAAGARLLGLYLLVVGIASLPAMAGEYEAAANSKFESPGTFALITLLSCLLSVGIGAFLLFRYRASVRSDVEVSIVDRRSLFIVGARLLGAWLLISGASAALSGIAHALAVESSWLFRFSQIGSNVLNAVAGGILVWHAPRLVSFIDRIDATPGS